MQKWQFHTSPSQSQAPEICFSLFQDGSWALGSGCGINAQFVAEDSIGIYSLHFDKL